jgi:hypothetical protein
MEHWVAAAFCMLRLQPSEPPWTWPTMSNALCGRWIQWTRRSPRRTTALQVFQVVPGVFQVTVVALLAFQRVVS